MLSDEPSCVSWTLLLSPTPKDRAAILKVGAPESLTRKSGPRPLGYEGVAIHDVQHRERTDRTKTVLQDLPNLGIHHGTEGIAVCSPINGFFSTPP